MLTRHNLMLTALRRPFGAMFNLLRDIRFAELHRTLRERRSMPRYDVEFDAILSCFGSMIRAHGLDISLGGAGLVVAEPIPAGVQVFVRLRDFGLQAFGTVRHCSERGAGRYRIGISFREKLSDAYRSREPRPDHQVVCEAVGAWDEPAD